MLTSRTICHFEVHFSINHQVFWCHQIIPLWYSSVVVLHSNILACDLADLPPWSSVKRNIQTFKDGLKISPAEVLWWASKSCLFWFQIATLWKFLCTEHNISSPLSSKSSNFKTPSQNQIRFSFEQRCMKHYSCIFPIVRACMPIFNNKQRSFSVSVEIYYPTTNTARLVNIYVFKSSNLSSEYFIPFPERHTKICVEIHCNRYAKFGRQVS